MAALLVKGGPLAGRRLPVEKGLVFGRVNADVTIDDPLISRRHALIRPVGDALEVEDLGSLNGTWVNGERITSSRRLRPGDLIALGETTAEVEAEEQTPTVTAPSPPAVAASRAPVAPPGSERALTATGDELRRVTVLFADIVGSTSLGEKLAPYEVKTLVGDSVTRMSREVERFGGSVQAYMGDGIAVYFGVPAVHEDDPERAARAGLAIIDTIREYAKEVEATWDIPDFNARVGINTGQVAVGLVGAAEPQSVSVGDTTNVAARLESIAEPGTIVVGEATARALIHLFVLEPLGDLLVKGREHAVPAWRLVSAQETAHVQPTLPLVGREDELDRFDWILDELDAGRGQVVVLTGEPGIGKTRLLHELGARAASRATWLEGNCLSFGTERLYDPFIRVLRTWVGVEEGEVDLAVRTKLQAKLDLLPEFDVAADMPYLARLLGATPGPAAEDDLHDLPPDELAARIRRAYRHWVTSMAQDCAVVIAVEDLHLADSSTCELASELLELTDQIPLLLVTSLRPERSSRGWAVRVRIHADYPHRAVELPLGPVPDTDAARLLEQLPRSGELDASDRDLIVAAAEGNPLYVEELLIGFTDGAAERRGTTWAPASTHRGLLTPTLENLMVSQIDRLAPEERQLAQTAAIVGRRFPRRVLEHLAARADLAGEITELLRAGVIRESRRYPEPEYSFRHGLLREAALSTLPPPRRRELYRAVAVAFETLYASSLDDQLEVLAHYYGRSDDLPKALEYLERAAVRALALDAPADAAELWQSALDIVRRLGGDPAAEARLQRRIDDAQTVARRKHDP
jgi:class 3 adenylate cyclase